MRTLLAAITLAVATGCIVRVPPPIRIEGSGHRAEERDRDDRRRCPPGHQWSDGRCHERGRGHDERR